MVPLPLGEGLIWNRTNLLWPFNIASLEKTYTPALTVGILFILVLTSFQLEEQLRAPLEKVRTAAQTLLRDGELAKKWENMNQEEKPPQN